MAYYNNSYDDAAMEEEGATAVETEQPKAPPLEIPIRDAERHETTEVIALDPFDLPHVDEVIEILVEQEATQMRWLRFAAAYFRVGRVRDTEKILMKLKGEYIPYKPGAQPPRRRGDNDFNPDRAYFSDPEGRALVGNALASLYLHFAREHRLSMRQSADKEPEMERPIAIMGNDYRTEQVPVQQLLARAEALLQHADKHSKTERVASLTWATKGEIQMEQYLSKLTKGGMSQTEIDKNLSQMLQSFQTSLDLRPNGMRAMFGKAAILFQKGQFKEAREQYARAIARYPGADPGPTRVALGLCYYELGQEGRAQECFERALELDPKSIDAQVCLAIIEMGLATDADRAAGATPQELARNQETARRLRERANDRLRIAYDLDKWNPLLKVHLANNFFYSSTRDFKRIGDLAKEAFNHTTSKHIKAEACFISARNFHDQGDTKNAATLYSKSLDHWAMFPLARYGHAQMELTQSKPDFSAALRAIQLVIDSPEGKDDEDCLLMVGALHAKMQNVEAALQALRRVTEKNPFRAEAWLQQALLEQSKYRQSMASAEEAIRCYDKAVAALRFNKDPIPYELYNNVGALKFRVGDFKGSLAAFDAAIKEKGGVIYESGNKLKLPLVTLVFNKARSLEGLGRFEEAEKLYTDLTELSQHYPGEVHVDAQLRLAAIAAGRGDFESSIETYMKPLTSSLPKTNVSDFYCFYGDLEVERAKMAELSSAKAWAESKFRKVVDVNTNDPYARVALGNLFFEEAQSLTHRKEDRAKSEGLIKEAATYFRTILKRNPTNVFAANGLGACHAIRGRYQTAQLILEKVREFADSTCPSVWINLAHVHVHEGAFEQAATLYDQCLKRFFDNRDPELSLYLANARFQATKYAEARSTVLAALKYAPADENLWFASANIDEAEAYQKLSLDPKLRTAASVQSAMMCLKRALSVYEWMMAKAAALAKYKNERTEDSDSVAKRAWKEASNPLQVPQHPSPPGVPANGAKVANPSAVLLARAKVATAELRGAAPSSGDLANIKKADETRSSVKAKEAEYWRKMGRRPGLERALGPSAVKSVSASAINRLAQLAGKRAEIVQEEMKKSESYLEAQRKLERKMEADRKKLEEIRQAELRRVEEERKRIQELEQKEQEKLLERQAELAKRTEELAKRFRQEEEEAAMKGARRSSRPHKKTKKLQESERQNRRFKAKKSKSSDASSEDSDSESEDEDEEEDEEGAQQEEEPVEEEEDDDHDEEPENENQSKVAAELERLSQEPGSSEQDWRWFQNKCKETLGEELVEGVGKRFIKDRIVKLIVRKESEEKQKSGPKQKRLKVVADDDEEGEEEADTLETPEGQDDHGQKKKKTRKVVSESEDDEADADDRIENGRDGGANQVALNGGGGEGPADGEDELS